MHYHNIYRFMLFGRLFFIFTYSMMNKKLSLIALLGLVASPLMLNGNVTFAAEDATATDKATEKVTEEVVDETLTDDGTALDGAETVTADETTNEAGDGELAADEAGDEAITDAFETTEDTDVPVTTETTVEEVTAAKTGIDSPLAVLGGLAVLVAGAVALRKYMN